MKNTFQLKINLAWFLEKCFLLFWAENTFGSFEKFRNVMLFVDYIKFGPQIFDCYIYFVLSIFFLISSIRI